MATVIYHNDLDGRCSAAIINYFKNDFDHLVFIEMDYKDKLDYSNLSIPIFILDFSFPEDIMQKVIQKYGENNIIWIDHHKTAKNYSYQYLPGLRNFEDKKYSGCELTWMFFRTDDMSDAVKFIGDYDKWALKYQPACFEFYEGMKLEKNGPTDGIWTLLFNKELADGWVSSIMENGEIVIKYRDNYCLDMVKSFGYETEIDGHKAFAMNVSGFGSKGFGGKMEEYPICISYISDGERYTVSLYSDGSVDVGLIAKKYKGGGHRGAAGFTSSSLPFRKG